VPVAIGVGGGEENISAETLLQCHCSFTDLRQNQQFEVRE